MKKLTKISIIVFAIFAIFFTIAYAFVFLKGKSIAIAEIEKITGKKATVGYLGLVPPLDLQIINLDIKGMFKADYIYISPSILGILSGNIILNKIKIKNPEFTYEFLPTPVAGIIETTSPQSVTVLPVSVPEPVPSVYPAPPKAEVRPPVPIMLKYMNIKGGKVTFIDRAISKEGIRLTIKDINFSLRNLCLAPVSDITNFDLKARIPWREGKAEGKIELEGWMNIFKKDIQANLRITDIDGIYLYPYYSTWVNLEKARIQNATLNFTSNIRGANNELVAECHLELTDIVRRPRAPEEQQQKAARITDAVLDIFRALNHGKIELNFPIRTRMDKPVFGFGNVKTAFEEKLMQARGKKGFEPEDVITLPTKLLQGTVKSATDITKSVIDGTFGLGKELKKAVADTFTKPSAPAPAEQKPVEAQKPNPEPQSGQTAETKVNTETEVKSAAQDAGHN